MELPTYVSTMLSEIWTKFLASPIAFGAPSLFVIAVLIKFFLSRPPPLNLPIAEGQPEHGNFSEMLFRAIEKVQKLLTALYFPF
jgi:hypothetical protein